MLTANRGNLFLVENAFFSKNLVKLIHFALVLHYNIEQTNSQTNDGNSSLEERFQLLSRRPP